MAPRLFANGSFDKIDLESLLEPLGPSAELLSKQLREAADLYRAGTQEALRQALGKMGLPGVRACAPQQVPPGINSVEEALRAPF